MTLCSERPDGLGQILAGLILGSRQKKGPWLIASPGGGGFHVQRGFHVATRTNPKVLVDMAVGQMKHGPKPAIPWWFNFDPYPYWQNVATQPQSATRCKTLDFAKTACATRNIILYRRSVQSKVESLL